MPNEIKSAFGGNLFALLGHEANFIRLKSQREINNLRRVAHLEIEFRHDIGAQPFQIAILHVATIGTKMSGDSARPRSLAKTRRRDRIGLGIFRIRHGHVARLPKRGDVVDVDAESQSSHRLQ